MRILGLDVGDKRIGIAVSDPLGSNAMPLETLERDGETLEKLERIAEENMAERLVVGLPLSLDGSEGAQARKVKIFSRELGLFLRIPVSFVDERLTTREAKGLIARSRGKHAETRGDIDKVAAALILQTFLDGRVGE